MKQISRGFTLIELLIVVAIIGILAAIAIPNFQNALTRAKVADVVSTLRAMETSIEQYRMDNNELPPHFNDPRQNLWLTTPVPYMSSRPYDPFQDFTTNPGANQGWSTYGANERQGCPHYEYLRQDGARVERSLALSGTPYLNYWIYSVGPDGLWSSESAPGLNIVYDISNGLNSNGDIIRFKADQSPAMLRMIH